MKFHLAFNQAPDSNRNPSGVAIACRLAVCRCDWPELERVTHFARIMCIPFTYVLCSHTWYVFPGIFVHSAHDDPFYEVFTRHWCCIGRHCYTGISLSVFDVSSLHVSCFLRISTKWWFSRRTLNYSEDHEYRVAWCWVCVTHAEPCLFWSKPNSQHTMSEHHMFWDLFYCGLLSITLVFCGRPVLFSSTRGSLMHLFCSYPSPPYGAWAQAAAMAVQD